MRRFRVGVSRAGRGVGPRSSDAVGGWLQSSPLQELGPMSADIPQQTGLRKKGQSPEPRENPTACPQEKDRDHLASKYTL